MRHVVDPGIQGALVAPVRHFEHHPGPRLTLKVVHGDEPTNRLNLRDQAAKASSSLPSIPGLTPYSMMHTIIGLSLGVPRQQCLLTNIGKPAASLDWGHEQRVHPGRIRDDDLFCEPRLAVLHNDSVLIFAGAVYLACSVTDSI